MFASSLATSYVMDPLMYIMGLRGCQLCVFWEGHKILGQLHWWETLSCNCCHQVLLGFNVPECVVRFIFEFGVGSFEMML